MSKLAIVLAEFGRPAPDVTQFRKTWPEAEIQVFAGVELPDVPRWQRTHPRYGWRMQDYWKVRKLLDSGADIAISFDADMRIVNREDARVLPLLAEQADVQLAAARCEAAHAAGLTVEFDQFLLRLFDAV